MTIPVKLIHTLSPMVREWVDFAPGRVGSQKCSSDMHISIIALGSLGDVLPLIALGKELRSRGHAVRLSTYQNFISLVQENGLESHTIRGDSRAMLSSSSGMDLVHAGRNVLRMAKASLQAFGSAAESYAQDLATLAQFETDLLINQLPGGLYGFTLAETLAVPLMHASVIPLAATAAEPMLAFPSRPSWIPGYNMASHWLAYQIVWQRFRPVINRWRKGKFQLSPAPVLGYFNGGPRRIPVLNGFSSHVVPRPRDWGQQIHITGYWFPDEPEWKPPEPLREFLSEQPPPVFFGFGSMPVRNPQKLTAIILEALQNTGQRGILHAGWAALGNMSMPSHIYRIEYAPYGWLYPQMAMLVHHGGSGTTAFGFKAGVPSLAVPFTFDQFYWGGRIHALGVGPEPISIRKLDVQNLTTAIRSTLSNGSIKERARVLGEKIRLEMGLMNAVDIIERRMAEF